MESVAGGSAHVISDSVAPVHMLCFFASSLPYFPSPFPPSPLTPPTLTFLHHFGLALQVLVDLLEGTQDLSLFNGAADTSHGAGMTASVCFVCYIICCAVRGEDGMYLLAKVLEAGVEEATSQGSCLASTHPQYVKTCNYRTLHAHA